MATGGWGGAYSNPFAAGGAGAADGDKRETGGAYGAWGGNGAGVGLPPRQAATPSAPAFIAPPPPPPFGGAPGGDAREAALARREADLARREAALQSAGGMKNWPSCCPIIYHNIRDQIPAWNRSMVRFTYLVELITLAGFFYNAIIILATLLANVGPGLQWWFLSVLALVLGGPLSWWLFYKRVFGAAQTDGGTCTYMVTFMFVMLHMAWCVWMVLGLPNLGAFSAGVFPMLRLFQEGGSKGVAFGIMFIINIALWGIAALGCWVVLGLAVAAYRRGDGPRRDAEARGGGGIQMNIA